MARLSRRAPSAHPHLNEINLVTSNFRPVGGPRDGKETRWKGLLEPDARTMRDKWISLHHPWTPPCNNECPCVRRIRSLRILTFRQNPAPNLISAGLSVTSVFVLFAIETDNTHDEYIYINLAIDLARTRVYSPELYFPEATIGSKIPTCTLGRGLLCTERRNSCFNIEARYREFGSDTKAGASLRAFVRRFLKSRISVTS